MKLRAAWTSADMLFIDVIGSSSEAKVAAGAASSESDVSPIRRLEHAGALRPCLQKSAPFARPGPLDP